MLAGEPKTAVALFAEALKLYRKSVRKRKGGLPGFVGLLHVCALLAADDAALHSEIEAQTEMREGHYGAVCAARPPGARPQQAGGGARSRCKPA